MKNVQNVVFGGAAVAVVIGMMGVAAAYETGSCEADNETDLRAAVLDESCTVVTILPSMVQNKGIQLSGDFDGNGKELYVDAAAKYGLLIDSRGLDGHTGSPLEITLSNFKISNEGSNDALINVGTIEGGMSKVTIRNVVSTQNNAAWPAHIDVKDVSELILENYTAVGGKLTFDYSPSAEHSLELSLTDFSSTAEVGLNNDNSNGLLTVLPADTGLAALGSLARGGVLQSEEELRAAGFLVEPVVEPEVDGPTEGMIDGVGVPATGVGEI